MLVLTRREGETIVVGQAHITIQRLEPGQVRLSIQAPRDVPVDRLEIWQRKEAEKCSSST